MVSAPPIWYEYQAEHCYSQTVMQAYQYYSNFSSDRILLKGGYRNTYSTAIVLPLLFGAKFWRVLSIVIHCWQLTDYYRRLA